MFLKNFMDSREGREISKVARESTTYNAFYEYWRDQLFERVMRLFVWENTENENNQLMSIKPKEIEQRLLLQGHCGITKIKGKGLTAMLWCYRISRRGYKLYGALSNIFRF